MDESRPELELPGFRFHPTEEELLQFYLKNIIYGKKLRFDIIGFLNIYRYEPSALPGMANIGEREWYFYVPRDRKRGNGGRPNRTTETGFWKATGSDRKIFNLASPKRVIGLRKTLVFYKGRAPRGSKTDWVMNEYRLPDSCLNPDKDIVLCKIYRKATSLKVLEQRAAIEDELKMKKLNSPSPSSSVSSQNETMTIYNCYQTEQMSVIFKQEEVEEEEYDDDEQEKALEKAEHVDETEQKPEQLPSPSTSSSSPVTNGLNLPNEMDFLQVSKMTTDSDWTQDQFWTQFNSPWLRNMTLNLIPY